MNNYRGISVIPALAKLFEKVIAAQINIYLKINNILCTGQHGFREAHSCETLLHELISELVNANDKKLITLLLFIDFKKAFDVVDSKLLLRKLTNIGFDNGAIGLITDYFTNREQIVKIKTNNSKQSIDNNKTKSDTRKKK